MHMNKNKWIQETCESIRQCGQLEAKLSNTLKEPGISGCEIRSLKSARNRLARQHWRLLDDLKAVIGA